MDSHLELREPRKYELGYHILPTVSEDDLKKRVASLTEILTSEGGLPLSEGYPEHMELAYEIDKTIQNKRSLFSESYFGWVRFDATPESIIAIDALLRKEEYILRYLLLSIDDSAIQQEEAKKRLAEERLAESTEAVESSSEDTETEEESTNE